MSRRPSGLVVSRAIAGFLQYTGAARLAPITMVRERLPVFQARGVLNRSRLPLPLPTALLNLTATALA